MLQMFKMERKSAVALYARRYAREQPTGALASQRHHTHTTSESGMIHEFFKGSSPSGGLPKPDVAGSIAVSRSIHTNNL